MQPSANPKEKATPEKKLLIFLLLSMITGVILSCFLEFLSIRGVFQKWELVGRVPKNTKELIGGAPMYAYVRTIENKTLSCTFSNSDECWIPNVYNDPFYTGKCDKERIAFSSGLKPPQNITSCIEIITSGGGGSPYDVIFVTDHTGNLWRWKNKRVRDDPPVILIPDIIIMIGTGAIGGILIGSIVWIIIRLVRHSQSSQVTRLFSTTHIVLLAIPWLCFVSFIGMRYIRFDQPFESSNPRMTTMQVEETSTAVARKTEDAKKEEAKKWEAIVTPDAGNVRYRFSDHACAAEWDSYRESISCSTSAVSPSTAVRVQSISLLKGRKIEGEAILLPTSSFTTLFGEYPAIEILEGDHFVATIACPQETSECNISFGVRFYIQDGDFTMVGRWSPNHENRTEEINLDLSRFVGRLVRFSFIVESDDYQNKMNQDVILIMPRLENNKR